MASSSDSGDLTSEDERTDTGGQNGRGRQPNQRQLGAQKEPKSNGAFIVRQGSGQSLSSNSGRSTKSRLYERRTFTRSRSPVVKPPSDGAPNGVQRPGSPLHFSRSKHNPPVAIRSLFPSAVCFHIRIPCTRYKVSFDTRQALENTLLLCSVGYSAVKIRAFAAGPLDPDMWISIGEVSTLSCPHRARSCATLQNLDY